jgi:single-strand selective monofunctional uracil DNA glycosylase
MPRSGPTQMSAKLTAAARRLADAVDALTFPHPADYVYNPLRYAWEPHRMYLERFARTRKRVLFLGMNPGPFGMAQTGVPFGEIRAVRDWMGIEAPVAKPPREHPRRAVEGFACRRSEISGQRLWGLFASRFGEAEQFFSAHFVANYCPLLFLEDTGAGAANVTPTELPSAVTSPLYAACDEHLRALAAALQPAWVIGVGAFAETRVRKALGSGVQVGRIPHPSPRNPAANAGWEAGAIRALEQIGVW